MVRVIALVTRVSGIGRVCLAINTVGCLGAAQIIKSGCVACASLVCLFFVFFGDYVSVSGRKGGYRGGFRGVGGKFLEKLLVRLKETVKEKEVGVPQSGSSGSGPSLSHFLLKCLFFLDARCAAHQ